MEVLSPGATAAVVETATRFEIYFSKWRRCMQLTLPLLPFWQIEAGLNYDIPVWRGMATWTPSKKHHVSPYFQVTKTYSCNQTMTSSWINFPPIGFSFKCNSVFSLNRDSDFYGFCGVAFEEFGYSSPVVVCVLQKKTHPFDGHCYRNGGDLGRWKFRRWQSQCTVPADQCAHCGGCRPGFCSDFAGRNSDSY